MAAIAALEALKRPCRVRLHTDSIYLRDGITRWITQLAPQRLDDRRPQAGQERRSVATPRNRTGAAPDRMGLGQGHAGHAENERADELARQALLPFKNR